MTPHNRTLALAHLSALLALALDADVQRNEWALLAWIERFAQDATVLADELLDDLRQELAHERATSSDF